MFTSFTTSKHSLLEYCYRHFWRPLVLKQIQVWVRLPLPVGPLVCAVLSHRDWYFSSSLARPRETNRTACLLLHCGVLPSPIQYGFCVSFFIELNNFSNPEETTCFDLARYELRWIFSCGITRDLQAFLDQSFSLTMFTCLKILHDLAKMEFELSKAS